MNAAAILAAALDRHSELRARAYHAQKTNPKNVTPVRKTAGPRLPRGVCRTGWRLAEAVALTHAANVPEQLREEAQAELIAEAKAAFALWLARGPRRPDGRGRFRKWSMNRAALTLWKRIRTAKNTAHRGHLARPPSSLLRTMQAACERAARALAKRPRTVLVFAPTAFPSPAGVFPASVLPASVLPASLGEFGNRFAAHVADRHLLMTGTWSSGARHRESVAKAARGALVQWLAVRTARHGRNVVGALLARAARAEAASVPVFTFWPASLHRDARKACQAVKVPAKVLQPVQLLAA